MGYKKVPTAEKDRIMELLRKGHKQVEVSAMTGWGRTTVSRVARDYRNGEVKKRTPVAHKLRKGTYQVGVKSVAQFMLSLPDEVLEWLDSQRPIGSTMAEFLRSILMDAYYESLDGPKKKATQGEKYPYFDKDMRYREIPSTE